MQKHAIANRRGNGIVKGFHAGCQDGSMQQHAQFRFFLERFEGFLAEPTREFVGSSGGGGGSCYYYCHGGWLE
jgi:hypothetical protein